MWPRETLSEHFCLAFGNFDFGLCRASDQERFFVINGFGDARTMEEVSSDRAAWLYETMEGEAVPVGGRGEGL